MGGRARDIAFTWSRSQASHVGEEEEQEVVEERRSQRLRCERVGGGCAVGADAEANATHLDYVPLETEQTRDCRGEAHPTPML